MTFCLICGSRSASVNGRWPAAEVFSTLNLTSDFGAERRLMAAIAAGICSHTAAGLPVSVDSGEIPSPPDLDAWTKDRTLV